MNALLHEAERLRNAGRYERREERRDYRSGHHERQLQTKTGEVALKVGAPRNFSRRQRGSPGLAVGFYRSHPRTIVARTVELSTSVDSSGHTINQWFARKRWQLNFDRVARLDNASMNDDAHNARFTYQSCRCGLEDVLEETKLEVFNLVAGITEAGKLGDRFWAESKPGASRQLQQINIPGRDILPEIPRVNDMPLQSEFIKQLCVNQMNLP